jgi:cyclopropane-fatty-acyl-phospholipid synthase
VPASPRTARADAGVVELVRILRRADVACTLELPWGEPPLPFGEAPPRFHLKVTDERLLRGPLTELTLGRAYVEGDLDVTVEGTLGDPEYAANAMAVFGIRDQLRFGMTPRQVLQLGAELALAAPTRVNARAVRHHYALDDDFYLTFLDTRYRFYSQCVFERDDDTLEIAAGRKLEAMREALGLQAGMRILDIGGGWGGLVEYCSALGVEVTSLTLSEESAAYIRARIAEGGLKGEVIVEDLLEHRARERYDHVVIFGVIEHIPTYGRFCERVWDALKPGGKLYLDASATKEKYAASPWTRRYTWRGPHSCLALPDMIEELIFHGFSVTDVRNDSRHYARTMGEWARRLDAAHDHVARRWGEHIHRMWRVFLWGGAHGFTTDRLQAYTLVAAKGPGRGPRPGRLRRAGHFAASLR